MEIPSKETRLGAGAHALALLFVLLLLTSAPGCGPQEAAGGSVELEDTQRQPLDSTNGLAMNGLAMNGLAMNGLAMNGLAMNGLSTSAFTSWFQQDPVLANMVMRYAVRCAVQAGESRTYTNPRTNATYTWKGSLGLAPGWASGWPATTAEQRIITACLAAHANRLGKQLAISVLGRGATGATIPFTSSELNTYSAREACFFGNLFTGEGIFIGLDGRSGDREGTTTRACTSTESGTNCAPLILVGECRQYCTLEDSGPFYKSCTYKGTTYAPITTRMRPEEGEED